VSFEVAVLTHSQRRLEHLCRVARDEAPPDRWGAYLFAIFDVLEAEDFAGYGGTALDGEEARSCPTSSGPRTRSPMVRREPVPSRAGPAPAPPASDLPDGPPGCLPPGWFGTATVAPGCCTAPSVSKQPHASTTPEDADAGHGDLLTGRRVGAEGGVVGRPLRRAVSADAAGEKR
jgi:hypothetical protein